MSNEPSDDDEIDLSKIDDDLKHLDEIKQEAIQIQRNIKRLNERDAKRAKQSTQSKRGNSNE